MSVKRSGSGPSATSVPTRPVPLLESSQEMTLIISRLITDDLYQPLLSTLMRPYAWRQDAPSCSRPHQK